MIEDEKGDVILDVLDFITEQYKEGKCTKRQTDVLYDAALNIVDAYATSDELAKHFGKSIEAVHGVIKRRMTVKPKKNITLYSFRAFRKIVPKSWLRKDQ